MSWRSDAACATHNPDLWQAEGQTSAARRDRAEAIAICATCPVRTACLNQALTHESGMSHSLRTGVWGGVTPIQRAKADRKVCRRCGGERARGHWYCPPCAVKARAETKGAV